MIKLCQICNKRYKNVFESCEDEKCFICGGIMKNIRNIAISAANEIKNNFKDCKTFEISTTLPYKILAREELVWDFYLSRSIKTEINKILIREIAKNASMLYRVGNADCLIKFNIEKLSFEIERNSVFIFGRYEKHKKNISQSIWNCKHCKGKGCENCNYTGVKYESIERILASEIKEILGAKDVKFHASGREDVDALNLAGRAFVVEVIKPTEKVDLNEIEKKINKRGEIKVKDLKYVNKGFVSLVGDSHFDKVYEVKVEIENFEKKDKEKILGLKNITIEQQTPERVKHRRKDMVRKRKILNIEIKDIKDKILTMEITAEAGTYIKEFIHGDNGRTKPSISEVLNKKARCEELKVIKIMDEFLDDIVV